MSLSGVIERAGIVARNLPYLPGVLKPLDGRALWSECNPGSYESAHHFAHALRAAVLPIYSPFREVPHLPYETPASGKPIQDGEAWYFLNGICTDRPVLRLNGKALADLFQRKVYLMHNPSDGVVLDLLECAVGRTLQLVSTLEKSVAHILEEALTTHDKVVFIVHSQGGIICTGALYRLANALGGRRARLLNKLEVYTFASAACELELPQVFSEHYIHRQDFVARIGVGAYPQKYSGEKFECDGSGHLFNTHYLSSLVQGRFRSAKGAVSRLAEKLQTRGPIRKRSGSALAA